CGSNQAFNIDADACYHIADVLVDGSSVGTVDNYLFSNVTANHTITETLPVDIKTITASAGAHGSNTPSGAVAVDCGTNKSFTNVTANHTIAASFAVNVETITASAGAHGSITPSGAVAVDCGTDQGFTIAADPCYHIADVLVDGSSVGAVGTYGFTNVTANHT